jgi:hypothetical protein
MPFAEVVLGVLDAVGVVGVVGFGVVVGVVGVFVVVELPKSALIQLNGLPTYPVGVVVAICPCVCTMR